MTRLFFALLRLLEAWKPEERIDMRGRYDRSAADLRDLIKAARLEK